MGENLKWFLKQFYPYRWLILIAFAGALLESLAYSGLSFVLKNLIDKVLVEKSLYLLKVSALALVGLGLLKQVGFLTSELLYKYAVAKISANIRMRVYSKLINLPLEEYQRLPQGEWVGRITNDVKSFKDYSEGFGIKVFRELFTAIFLTAVLLYFDWKLFLIFIAITPLLSLAFRFFGSKRKRYSRIYQEKFALFLNYISNLLENFENVKFLKRRFINLLTRAKILELFRAEYKLIFYSATYLSVIELLGYLFASAIILYGGYRVVEGELSAGTFVAFIGTLFLLYNSLQALQRTAINYRALQPVIERIREVLERFPSERGGNIPFKGLKNSLRVENLLFPNHSPILKEVNLSIPAGAKVFVKGPSGGGKSTLLKLLAGLYRTYGGKIFYDLVELRDFSLKSFRGKVFYLSQNSAIFNDTVRNNLLVANPNATERELMEALKLARAEFVLNLPKGLDTLLGGGGVQISGGQRQRIALARLFLTRPEIIFLDEATSALDLPTEREVLKNILSHYSDKTVFFVSHRRELENNFDLILEIKEGTARVVN